MCFADLIHVFKEMPYESNKHDVYDATPPKAEWPTIVLSDILK